MKRGVVALLFSMCLGCASVELDANYTPRTCPITTVTALFASPREADGVRFCGLTRAVHEGRVVKLFPAEAPLPNERRDLVLLPNLQLQDLLSDRIAEGEEQIIYIEGVISVDEACFSDPETMCLPYRRPIEIRVSSFRLLTNEGSER